MRPYHYAVFLLIAHLGVMTYTADSQNIQPAKSSEYQYAEPGKGISRILTYNVRNGKGMDGKTDYDRVAAVINAIHPEVVALQELDSATTRSSGTDVLKVLAQKCGMKYVYGASLPYQGGKYGIGILSKETPVNTQFFQLPGREEKRGLLMAEFKNYIFFCSHFSLTAADRVASVSLINQKAKELKKRVFLAGDLNATPKSEEMSSLSADWINLSGVQLTCPSPEPKVCIDYIWGINCCGLKYNIIKQEVVPEKTASDHRPVFVDVKFK